MNSDELRKKWGVEASDSNDKNSHANENKTSVTQSKYFKVDIESPFITSLKLICRDGHVIFMPYSLQPIIEYLPAKGIYIKTLQREILITGRNLTELLDHLGMQKVKWIKESANDKDNGEEGLFIQNIVFEDI